MGDTGLGDTEQILPALLCRDVTQGDIAQMWGLLEGSAGDPPGEISWRHRAKHTMASVWQASRVTLHTMASRSADRAPQLACDKGGQYHT